MVQPFFYPKPLLNRGIQLYSYKPGFCCLKLIWIINIITKEDLARLSGLN
jgi:hypothetical protein